MKSDMIEARCPKCGKRVMDVSKDMIGRVVTKCHRCNTMVSYEKRGIESKEEISTPELQ